jgi:ornithine cyclodeaminase/alanine dehydrogenase-like protein (mu-crystallin family)
MRHIDDATVAATLTPAAACTVVRDALVAAAWGRADNPVRAVATPPGGWFAAMPAYVDSGAIRALGAKLVCVLPGNAARGFPTHRAVVALFDADTGAPVALVDADTITLRRTAAASVVATRALAARPAGTYALLGAGAQGRAHADAFLDAGLVHALRVWSRTREHADALAAALSHRTRVVVSDTADDAVHRADVVVTATASPGPLFAADAVARHVHVNAVGACVPSRRELCGALVANADVYVDSRAAALREAGDLLLAMPEHLLDAAHVRGEIGNVLAARQGVRHVRPTIYESLGLGILDVACAAFVLERRGDSPGSLGSDDGRLAGHRVTGPA